MKVGMLQYAPAFGRRTENLARVERMLAGAGPLDLLVLPELFASGYAFPSSAAARAAAEPASASETVAAMVRWGGDLGATVVGGFPESDGPGGAVYNSAAVCDATGLLGVYRKVHLFGGEQDCFAPGDLGFPVWERPWGRLGVMICYDWRFPEACRTLALSGVEVVALPANLVFAEGPRVLPARALENRLFIVAADRTGEEARPDREPLSFQGQSLAVDPFGAAVARIGPGEERLARFEIDPARARDKSVGDRNDCLADRRVDQYRLGASDPNPRP